MPTTTVEITQDNATVTRATARQHTVLIDRPASGGGTDNGAKARELFLMSLGGCFMKNLQAAITARNAPIQNIRIDVTGEASDRPKRFQSITLSIYADYADAAQMQKLVTIAERSCLLANTLRDAVNLTVVVAESQSQ